MCRINSVFKLETFCIRQFPTISHVTERIDVHKMYLIFFPSPVCVHIYTLKCRICIFISEGGI